MKKNSKYDMPWWDEFYKADYFRRKDMIENLPFVQELIKGGHSKIPITMKKYIIVSFLNSFFEDLIEYMHKKKNG